MLPRDYILWNVLERAIDAGDAVVVAACREIIVASRKGFRAGVLNVPAMRAKWRMILEMNEDC